SAVSRAHDIPSRKKQAPPWGADNAGKRAVLSRDLGSFFLIFSNCFRVYSSRKDTLISPAFTSWRYSSKRIYSSDIMQISCPIFSYKYV
ncbi:MAG: hypothetical protein ACTSYF_00380, partial [Promethearchaeota archaeon]